MEKNYLSRKLKCQADAEQKPRLLIYSIIKARACSVERASSLDVALKKSVLIPGYTKRIFLLNSFRPIARKIRRDRNSSLENAIPLFDGSFLLSLFHIFARRVQSLRGETRWKNCRNASAAQSPGYFPEAEVTTGQSASELGRREKLKVVRVSGDAQRVNEESGVAMIEEKVNSLSPGSLLSRHRVRRIPFWNSLRFRTTPFHYLSFSLSRLFKNVFWKRRRVAIFKQYRLEKGNAQNRALFHYRYSR